MNQIEAPKLFNNRDDVPDGQSKAVTIPVSPEGCYIGNGQFQDPEGMIFNIIGFDKRRCRERWIGRGWIYNNTDRSLKI